MRSVLRVGGTLLIVASVLGMAALAALLLNPEPAASPFPAAIGQGQTAVRPGPTATIEDDRTNAISGAAIGPPALSQGRTVCQPITPLDIPATSLSTDAV